MRIEEKGQGDARNGRVKRRCSRKNRKRIYCRYAEEGKKRREGMGMMLVSGRR